MAETYFPFDAGAGANTTEDGWAKMARLWERTGVVRGELNGLAVTANGGGMNVTVASGRAWIEGFFYENDGPLVLPIGAADLVNPRIDRIVARLDRNANTIHATVIAGVPAAVPVTPAALQGAAVWDVTLATVLVPAAALVIGAGNVTDRRTYSAPIVDRLDFRPDVDTPPDASIVRTGAGTLQVNAGVTVAGAFHATGAGTFDAAVMASSTLHVVGAAVFDSTVNVAGGLTVAGLTQVAQLNASSDVYAQVATVNQVKIGVAGGISAGIEFGSSANFMGNISANNVAIYTDGVQRATFNSGGLSSTGKLTISAGGLDVAGQVTLTSAGPTLVYGGAVAHSSFVIRGDGTGYQWRLYRRNNASVDAQIGYIDDRGVLGFIGTDFFVGPAALGATGKRLHVTHDASFSYLRGEDQAGTTSGGNLYLQAGSLYFASTHPSGDFRFFNNAGALAAVLGQSGNLSLGVSAGGSLSAYGVSLAQAGNGIRDLTNNGRVFYFDNANIYMGEVDTNGRGVYIRASGVDVARFSNAGGGISTSLYVKWWDNAGTDRGLSNVLNVSVSTMKTTGIYDTYRVLVLAA